MADAIRAGFERDCAHLAIDQNLVKRLRLYQTGFVNKNSEHAEFFGGHTIGVQVVRFTDQDRQAWFDDIIDTNEEQIYETHHRNPALNGANGLFKVAGDPMNLSCVWLVHKLHSDTKMSAQARREGMIDALMIMQYKFLTSRLYRHFKYVADPEVAEAAYESLNNKYSIRRLGSWYAVLLERSNDIISASSPHYRTIAKMDSDVGVSRMIADIQNRIRDMLKNIYNEFILASQKGNRVTSTSAVVEFDGVESVRDQVKGVQNYKEYLKTVIADKNDFIRRELLKVIEDVHPAAPPKHLEATLNYISVNHLRSSDDRIDKMLDAVMVHSFAYLSANKSNLSQGVDLAALLIRLRGVYTSSRSTDPDLLALREMTEVIVAKAIDSKTKSMIAAVRTAVLLYLVARAYSMRYYTSGAKG